MTILSAHIWAWPRRSSTPAPMGLGSQKPLQRLAHWVGPTAILKSSFQKKLGWYYCNISRRNLTNLLRLKIAFLRQIYLINFILGWGLSPLIAEFLATWLKRTGRSIFILVLMINLYDLKALLFEISTIFWIYARIIGSK